VGIRTTDALLEAACTVKRRKALSAKTGINEQQLLEWANVSDYMRIPGMGKANAEQLRDAGVTTVRELAQRHPARLAQNMKEVNARRKMVRVMPSEKSVEQLITQASKLQSKITRITESYEELVPPKGMLVDILIPATRAEDMQLMLQRAFEERWVPKYGARGARRLYMLQSLGAVVGYWINWTMQHLGILKLFAS
jgi:predicted flap endonuclease-1-like 5' DNA nuclease